VLHHVEVQVLVLLLIASLVAMIARRFRQPYTLALVAAGLVLGLVNLQTLAGVGLAPEVLLLLMLPALLFEAAFRVDETGLRRDVVPVLVLAIGGVLLAVPLTAVCVYAGLAGTHLSELGWGAAFLFAAILSATDPVSVLALFKELGAPRRLHLLMEGESLLNDGVAVVMFLIVGAIAGAGGQSAPVLHGVGDTLSWGLRSFLWMAGGGVIVGWVVGRGMAAVTATVDDHLIEVTLTTLVAYGSFLLAEQVHASGVLSTVTAGAVMGTVGRREGMSPTTRIAVEDFWEYAAFLANSFVFLLVGLELEPAELVRAGPAILVAFVAVIVARAIVVHTLAPLLGRFGERIPMAWRHVMVWGGLRGSLSMVLVLSLPTDFPGRSTLVALVFGVVALSLFVQGLTVGPLLARLGLRGGATGDRWAYQLARGRAIAATRAAEAAEALERSGVLPPPVRSRLVGWYRQRAEVAVQEALVAGGDNPGSDEMLEGIRLLADAEQEAIRGAGKAGVLPPEVERMLAAGVRHRLTELSEAAHAGDDPLREALEKLLEDPEHAE